MTSEPEPNSSLDRFNLGFFTLKGKIEVPGRSYVHSLDKENGPIKDMSQIFNTHLALLRDTDTVQQIPLYSTNAHIPKVLFKAEGTDKFSSIAVYNDILYILNHKRNIIHKISFNATNSVSSQPGRMREHIAVEEQYQLPALGLLPDTRLRIMALPSSELIAVIGPTQSGEMFTFPLYNVLHWTRNVTRIALPHTLPGDTRYCIDYIANTLLITNPASTEITEFFLLTGETRRLFPSPDTKQNKGRTQSSKITWKPNDLAIARLDPITISCLSSKSASIVSSDHLRIKPRTLLLCDRANACIRQIIDLPAQADALLKDVSPKKSYLLLGSNKRAKEVTTIKPEASEDLRMHDLPAPAQIMALPTGDTVISFINNTSLLHLRPATIVAENNLVTRKDVDANS